jgi:2TM domain-containing protein
MATENLTGEPATVSPEPDRSEPPATSPERVWARKRIEKKRKLRSDIAAYVVINAFLIGVWAVTGAGYFWPGWVLAGWGVLLLLDAWNLHDRLPVTEDDIDRELRNRR